MGTTVSRTSDEKIWKGGNKPLNASYGKMMMWFFIVSDALTFSGFIVSYGFARFKYANSWPIADEVFTHGHKMNKAKVTFYMFLTIIGGIIFVGSQAWEWATFIKGDYGAVKTKGGNILQFLDAETSKRVAVSDFAFVYSSSRDQHQKYNGIWYREESTLPSFSVEEVIAGLEASPNIVIRTQNLDDKGHKTVLSREESLDILKSTGVSVVNGANLIENEYGVPLFANFFFFITGFHGFHVFSGIVLNIIIFFNVIIGTYEKRKSYEMVEKVGLYWHFVDLVWVFVFTFFYLV